MATSMKGAVYKATPLDFMAVVQHFVVVSCLRKFFVT
jgi:hypothetical protein